MDNVPPTHRLWYDSCRAVFRTVGALVFRARYTGQQNIPREGPVVVVSNHQSHLDPPMVGAGVPRRMNFLARESLFHSPLLGKYMLSVGAVPIDLDGSPLSGIKETLRRLKRGAIVLLFPEGSRCWDGEVAPFRPGFTALAQRSGAAIVPAAIEGAHQAWPRTRSYPLPGTIHIHYGPPLWPDEIRQYGEQELIAEVERRVRQHHAQLRRHPAFARHDKDCRPHG